MLVLLARLSMGHFLYLTNSAKIKYDVDLLSHSQIYAVLAFYFIQRLIELSMDLIIDHANDDKINIKDYSFALISDVSHDKVAFYFGTE